MTQRIQNASDIVGKRFGQMTVSALVETIHVTSSKRGASFRYIYLCLCDCGNPTKIARVDLVSPRKHTQSCGCLKHVNGKKSRNWTGHGEISGRHWADIKNSATRKRSIPFSITLEDAWAQFVIQNGKCALTGWPLSLATTRRNHAEKTASLDRIDNSKGYDVGNIQWVHKEVNQMKSAFSCMNLMMWCQLVTQHAKGLLLREAA